MSEIKVNSIKGVGATSAAITVNNTDGSCTANLSNRQNRNLIINGAMQVAQRGTTSTSSGIHTVDRFTCEFSGTDASPTQEHETVAAGTEPYTSGFRNSFKVVNGNQSGGAGASDFINIQTKLEAQDIANSGWNYTSSSSYVTLSFWIRSTVAQTFKGFLRTRDGTEQRYAFDTGSLSANTWTKITKTIPGNSNITINNDTGEGLQINIGAFWGGTFTDSGVTENAWGAYSGSTRMKDNTSTWYTTNLATLQITGVQLEVGSVATDFEHRSFAQELALCQRYFFRVPYAGTGATPIYIASGVESSANARYAFILPQAMRAAPTVTVNDLSSDDEQSVTDASTVQQVVAGSSNCDRMRLRLEGGSYSSGNATSLITNSTSSFVAANAEL